MSSFLVKNISTGIDNKLSAELYDNQNNTLGSALKFHKTQAYNSTTSNCELGYVDFYGTFNRAQLIRVIL